MEGTPIYDGDEIQNHQYEINAMYSSGFAESRPSYGTGHYYSDIHNTNGFFPNPNSFPQLTGNAYTLPQSSSQPNNESFAPTGINQQQAQPSTAPPTELENMMPVPEFPHVFFDPSSNHGKINLGPMLPSPNHIETFKMHYRHLKLKVDYWNDYLKEHGIEVCSTHNIS